MICPRPRLAAFANIIIYIPDPNDKTLSLNPNSSLKTCLYSLTRVQRGWIQDYLVRIALEGQELHRIVFPYCPNSHAHRFQLFPLCFLQVPLSLQQYHPRIFASEDSLLSFVTGRKHSLFCLHRLNSRQPNSLVVGLVPYQHRFPSELTRVREPPAGWHVCVCDKNAISTSWPNKQKADTCFGDLGKLVSRYEHNAKSNRI